MVRAPERLMMWCRLAVQRGRTGFEEHKDFPIRLHSLIAARYQVKEYLGSAAFSKAVQCLDLAVEGLKPFDFQKRHQSDVPKYASITFGSC